MAYAKVVRILRLFLERGGLIYLPVAVFAFISPVQAENEPTAGLQVTVYDNYWYNGSPPLPDESGRPIVGTTSVVNVDYNFDAEPLFNMYEDFIVRFDGYITSPSTKSIAFLPSADDGTKLFIDGTLVDDNWRDKGGGGYPTAPIEFVEGESKPFTLWFYENGGGANVQLYWDINGDWEIVPASAFSTMPTTTTTTTTTLPKTLGVPTNVSVIDNGNGIFVDWDAAQDNSVIEPERYAISWSSAGSGWGVATGNVGDPNALNTEIFLDYSLFESTGGLDTSYMFTVRADNDTEGIYSQQSEQVSLVVVGPTTTTATTTTTTTEPPVETTVPETSVPESTTNPEIEAPETTDPPVTEPVIEEPTTTDPLTTDPPLPDPTEPPQPDNTDPPVDDEPIDEPVEEPTDEPSINDVLDGGLDALTDEELLEVLSPENLDDLSAEEVEDLISSIADSDLTEEQAFAIAEALSDAPDEVKQQFEEEINVFDGSFDNYVPFGSIIDVGQRRVLIAATAVVFAMPAPTTGSRRMK